jgi:hypothetical protein
MFLGKAEQAWPAGGYIRQRRSQLEAMLVAVAAARYL